MGDNVLLVVAEEGDELVAGALNLIGGDTLFGRLWGCLPRSYYPSLHFEACYYQVMLLPITRFWFYSWKTNSEYYQIIFFFYGMGFPFCLLVGVGR